jgi:hypothetical protein
MPVKYLCASGQSSRQIQTLPVLMSMLYGVHQ